MAMGSNQTFTYWGMVINNYDENDLALVRNSYPQHIRLLTHTLEKGEQGTPHIQAFIQLQRQQRLSFMKKLFPRANFQPLSKDEYVLNTSRYAQKQDETAISASTTRHNDPIMTPESVIRKVVSMMAKMDRTEGFANLRGRIQRDLVCEDFRYARIFVSATYKAMWEEYAYEMWVCLREADELRYPTPPDSPTHTHTHTQEGDADGESEISVDISIPVLDAVQEVPPPPPPRRRTIRVKASALSRGDAEGPTDREPVGDQSSPSGQT